MPKKHTFTATIQNAGGGGAFVEVPPELEKAFKKEKAAEAYFNSLVPSHKKEYVTWINEAKKDETRQNRVAKTIAMLKKGKRGV